MLQTKIASLGGWGGFCSSAIGAVPEFLAFTTPTIYVLIALATAILTGSRSPEFLRLVDLLRKSWKDRQNL